MEQYKYIKQFKYSRKTTVAAVLKQQQLLYPQNTFNTLCLLLSFQKHYDIYNLLLKSINEKNPRYLTPRIFFFFKDIQTMNSYQLLRMLI